MITNLVEDTAAPGQHIASNVMQGQGHVLSQHEPGWKQQHLPV